MNILIETIWFLVPCAIANMIPSLLKGRFNLLNFPIDFGKKFFDGKRIFGDNKTFRGLIFGTLFCILTVFIQQLLYVKYEFIRNISIIDYSQYSFVFLGFLIGAADMIGDMFGSFIKRRLNIKPGGVLFPLDQADSAIFLMLFLYPVFHFSFWFSLLTIIVWLIGHLLINYIGWLLKLKKNKL